MIIITVQEKFNNLELTPFNTIDSIQVMKKAMLSLQSLLLEESNNVETGNH